MTAPNQSVAVNHVAKFVAEELILDPKGFCRLTALLRVYWDWCESRGVTNRRLPGSILLLRLEDDFELKCGNVYAGDGRIYALRGVRLMHPALNRRSMTSIEGGKVDPSKAWAPIIDGVHPDRVTRIESDMSRTDEAFDDE